MVSLEAPQLQPASRRTLLDVANVITGAPAYALHNRLKYWPQMASGTNRDVPTDGSDKVFDKRPSTEVQPELFKAYRGLDAPLLNGPADGNADLEALFTAGEALFVEKKVQELLLSPQAVDITPTPGTPLTNAKAALGLLEQWIAERYLYQPTIAGNLLTVNLIDPGSPYVTESVNSTKIAAAAGFTGDGPGTATAGPGTAWLYISGQINIWEGQAMIQNGPDYQRNRDLVLAEKAYAASIDGPVAAILIGYKE